jgi:tight adherence protein C
MLQRLARGMQRVNRRGGQIDERQASAIQHRLNLAGNPHRWTPSDFLGVKTLGALIGAGLIFLLLTAARQPGMAIIGAGVGALIGFMLPELYLRQLIGQRKDEILRALPDALDLLCISVEAGLGFDGALSRLVQKTDNALTREFGKALQEVRVGRPRREALREVIARTDVPDLANFISAVVQADQLGVSVTQVLSVQSDQMRVSRRQRAQEKAAQAPLKMLFPMMIFIFPALCVVILGPLWPQIAAVSFPR